MTGPRLSASSAAPTAGVLAVACALGCGRGEQPDAPTFTVRDSAGVRIVEYANTAGAPRWELAEAPALTLGADDAAGSDALYRVTGGARLADGRVVIANGGSHELRVYDESGEYQRSIGRNGSGPGEFRAVSSVMALAPDSLLVYDGRLTRLSVFDAAGEFVRAFYLDMDPIVTPVGVDSAGILAYKASHMASLTRMGLNIDSALIVRFDRDGAIVDSLGRHPHNWRFRQRYGEIQSTLGVPFSPVGQLVPWRGGYCYGAGATYAVTCYGSDGRPRHIVRFADEPAPVTSQMVDRFFEEETRTAPANRRQAIARMRADLPIPPTLPAISDLVADVDGNVWLADYPIPNGQRSETRWRVLDPSGVLLAVVTTAAGVEPLEIGGDYVLAKWLDEYDVEYVSLFGLSSRE